MEAKRIRLVYKGGVDLPAVEYLPFDEVITDEDYKMGIVEADVASEISRFEDTDTYHSEADQRLVGMWLVSTDVIHRLEHLVGEYDEYTEETVQAIEDKDSKKMQEFSEKRHGAAAKLVGAVEFLLANAQEAL